MKNIFLSLLAVAMIGLMVPSAFALEDRGDFLLVYEETKNYQDFENWVKEWGYFEQQVEWLNDVFKLPYDIPIFVAECDEITAYYYYEDYPPYSEIAICYELIEEIGYYKSQDYYDDESITNATINVVDFILYHEIGHALIHLYDLPITGAEEDVADQFAAYVLLTSGVEGEDVSMYVIDAAEYWLDVHEDYGISPEHYAGIHSLDIQRFYDLGCYVYGSGSEYNQDIIDAGWVPENRIDYCVGEFEQILHSWDRLLDGFLLFEETSYQVPTKLEKETSFVPPTTSNQNSESSILVWDEQNGYWDWSDTIPGTGYYDDEVSLTIYEKDPSFSLPAENWSISGTPRSEDGLTMTKQNYDGAMIVGIDYSDYDMESESKKFKSDLSQTLDGDCIYKWETFDSGVLDNDEKYERYFTYYECDVDGAGQKIDWVGSAILKKSGDRLFSYAYIAPLDEKAIFENAWDITYSILWFKLDNVITQESSSNSGGGCLIATAAFGSEMAPQVQFLREIRDNTVLQTQSGTAFMTGFNQFYYSFSPQIADYERENPVFKEAVKVTLTPLLTSLTLLNYVEIDSEEEMLGYGIGIILLNVGMYFVAPAVLIISLKKKLQK